MMVYSPVPKSQMDTGMGGLVVTQLVLLARESTAGTNRDDLFGGSANVEMFSLGNGPRMVVQGREAQVAFYMVSLMEDCDGGNHVMVGQLRKADCGTRDAPQV